MGNGLGSWFWALAGPAVKQSEKQNRIEITQGCRVFIEDYLSGLSVSDSLKAFFFLSIVPHHRAKASFTPHQIQFDLSWSCKFSHRKRKTWNQRPVSGVCTFNPRSNLLTNRASDRLNERPNLKEVIK